MLVSEFLDIHLEKKHLTMLSPPKKVVLTKTFKLILVNLTLLLSPPTM